jgi:hypothetical protein
LNDLAVNRSSSDYKGFLAQEIIKLVREHKAALEVLASNKSLMKLYKEKLAQLLVSRQVDGSPESNQVTEEPMKIKNDSHREII